MVDLTKQEPKFCTKCEYFDPAYFGDCYHPKSVSEQNMVTGRKTYCLCSYMRNGECGESAVLFEPKKSLWEILKSML